MDQDLIFDIGAHFGIDTEFYLRKGFRVVAVEASEECCAKLEERFAQAIAEGRLFIVQKAIAEKAGEVTFYDNDELGWGTLYPEWAERNRRLGANSSERTITAITIADLVAEYGVPYYAKIDIEGADMVAVQGFAGSTVRPKYLSVESNKTSFVELRAEFSKLQELGYDRFKVVPQLAVPKQRLPDPAREGSTIEYRFPYGASGAFGEEAPGEWLTAEEAIEAYRPVFIRYALVGDDPLIRSKFLRRALWFSGYRAGWYDTHARRS